MLDNLLIMWYSSATLNQEVNFMKYVDWNKYNAAADLDPFPDIRYQCPVCYKSFKEEYDECPNCGLVIKRTCYNCNKVRCFIVSPGSSLCHLEKKRGI